MVRVLASHRFDPGLNPGIYAFCGLSLFVLSFAPKGFSPGTPLFPGGGGGGENPNITNTGMCPPTGS